MAEPGVAAAAPSRTGGEGLVPRLHLLYLVSGAAALAIEVVWSRKLHRVLGSGSMAVSLTLAAFLLGMGLGALCAQAWLRRPRNALRAFAVVEFAAAALTLGLSLLLEAPGLFRFEGGELLAGLLVVAATLPLGANFPILIAALPQSDAGREAARNVRRLYGANAIGGAAGALAAGLAGVPLAGERSTLLAAAALQAAAGAWAALLARGLREGRGAASQLAPEPSAGGERPAQDAPPAAAMALFVFGSGFAVFFWEVLWTRILVLTAGSSIYAFALVTASVVLGIGAGSLAAGRLGPRPALWLLPLLTALLLAAGYFAVPRLPDAYLFGVRSLALHPLLCGALGAGLVVFLPNFLLGSLFPLTVSRKVRLAGWLYAANCLGCVSGAFLAGPLSAGRWPLEAAYRAGIALLLLLALLGLRQARSAAARRGPRLAQALLAALAGAVLFSAWLAAAPERGFRLWRYEALLSGVYQWSRQSLESQSLAESYALRELLAVVEGREAIVSVELDREANTLYVRSNGKVEGSVPRDPALPSVASLSTQLILGTLPAFLANPNSDWLVIGLGSGVTAGALREAHARLGAGGVIEGVEIEPAFLEALRHPAVIESIRPYFDADGDPGAPGAIRWRFGDARRVLGRDLAGRRFGLIASQPSEPWIAAASSLFTVEFFREAAARLEPGGIFAQWVQLYKLDPESLRLLVRSFRRVFPRVHALRPPRSGELILLGSDGRLPLEKLLAAPPVRHLEAMGITGPLGWLAVFVLGPRGIERWVGLDRSLPVNTDGRGELEFRAPRALYLAGDPGRANLEVIRSFAAGDPVTRYLPESVLAPHLLQRLARANILLGDLEEAAAILAVDTSVEADTIREEIAEAARRTAPSPGERK
jgi:spermidine synthase